MFTGTLKAAQHGFRRPGKGGTATERAQRWGRIWTTEELALGFVGDVGDLAKLIQAHAGVRDIDDCKAKLGHELSDCLWSILVLANKCGIDLEAEFVRNTEELVAYVSGELGK